MNKRLECIKLLGGKCVKCGSTHRLEFDHIDNNIKNFRIASATRSWANLLEELKLCQLLCYDCHLEKTLAERYIPPIKHGTPGAYNNRKCRCDLCCAAWTAHCYSKTLHWNGRKYVKTV